MTHELPGNPWVDYFIHNTRQASAALHSDHIEGSERLSQEALGNAVLALAYEQRTANLLKVLELQGRMHDTQQAFTLSAFDVAPRLGLGDNK